MWVYCICSQGILILSVSKYTSAPCIIIIAFFLLVNSKVFTLSAQLMLLLQAVH